MCSHAVGKFYKTQSSGKEDNKSTPVPSQAKEPPQDEALSTKRHGAVKREASEVITTKPTKKTCYLTPEPLWRLFPRQQMAFDFSRSCYQSSAVFAFESEVLGTTGQRKYLVTTYYEFGQRYLDKKGPRHYYEVIVEDSACRLYFDIEFKTELNQNTDGNSALGTFIQYICYQLYVHFGLSCDRGNILDLESSAPSKFSRHLIFHLPLAVFKNNIHAGQFVHHCCDELRAFQSASDAGEQQAYSQHFPEPVKKKRSKDPPPCPTGLELKRLFVLNEQGKTVLLCDEGVYTRNRNFRLYLSSKLGKGVPLLVSKDSRFRSSYGEDSNHRRRSQKFNTLMDSLVCNVSFNSCSRVLEFTSAEPKITKSSATAVSSREGGGNQLSPFPLVDAHITSTLTRGGAQGNIRRWTYFSQGKQIVYDIQHNRWCENIGRTHRSNNIMIIADLMRGVFYQKCHDPECKRANFRGNEKRLPAVCNPVPNQLLNSAESGDNLSTLLGGDITDRDICEMEAGGFDTEEPEQTRCGSPDWVDGLMLEALAEYEATQGTAANSPPPETDYNISIEEMNSFCEDIDEI
ncbi:DNA-directed primase/polymerase protein-like [Halichondria panicea]|uniref:DNA-directed primase/polymerase protein-like n=1 Tax=Halichondria panicea TaxID=6063 RepID=UPI00312B470C